jgi:hypothetical protein
LMEFECARIIGIESKLKGLRKLPYKAIMEHMPPSQATFLLTETIRRKGKVTHEDIHDISEYFGELPKMVAAAIAQISLRTDKTEDLGILGLEVVVNRDIRSCVTDETVIYPKRIVRVPKLNVIHSLLPVKLKNYSFVKRSGLVKVMHEVTLIGGSDAVVYRGKYYFDRLSFKDSRILNPLKDPIVATFTRRKVAIYRTPEASLSLDEALWLGYPVTSSWGHFILECLTRVSMLLANRPTARLQVVISRQVPTEFIEMLTYIFPGVLVKTIGIGQSVKIRKCWLIPSTVFLPYNFYPAQPNTKVHSADSSNLALLSNAIHDALVRNGALAAKYPTNIYLSRNLAKYRKDASHREFERIAAQNGFFIVDPGELNIENELNLFYNAERIVGVAGSQMLLVTCVDSLKDALVLSHDQLGDLAYGSYLVEQATGIRPKYILGRRENSDPTFSEPSIHQAAQFEPSSIRAIENWLCQAPISNPVK